MEYGVYGDVIVIFPKPYSIYLRGTVGFWVLGLGFWGLGCVIGFGGLESCDRWRHVTVRVDVNFRVMAKPLHCFFQVHNANNPLAQDVVVDHGQSYGGETPRALATRKSCQRHPTEAQRVLLARSVSVSQVCEPVNDG